ncbi:N-acetyltransferase [Clostridium sp. C2-6-12]|uniref:N-acetyltransferase n=1 Tax=Clostridium sp. C2-6-12 TaxID=2698832 RepID=UPI00136A9C3F|nr:N-acetyltransferase [Clostridium sp. C2-6-12]
MDIYEKCPVLENDNFIVRLIEENDVDDLFSVYSDKYALPYFNSDNCNGDNFYCSKREYMQNAIKFWLIEYYENRAFVRFSIVDKKDDKAIGTIEMFRRESEDYYNDCGMLRLDVRSDYENTQFLYDILSLIVVPFFDWFKCTNITTKAPIYAIDRIEALKKMNFIKSPEPLVGKSMIYNDYWIRKK